MCVDVNFGGGACERARLCMKCECIVLVVVAANAALCLCMKYLQVPLETLEIAGMLINFHSSKFGYSIL